jgi:hypothetical protein
VEEEEMKLTDYECNFRLNIEEGDILHHIAAETPAGAARKFADYAHYRLGCWEWSGNDWDGDRAVGVRPVGRETWAWYNVTREVVPSFSVTPEPDAA